MNWIIIHVKNSYDFIKKNTPFIFLLFPISNSFAAMVTYVHQTFE